MSFCPKCKKMSFGSNAVNNRNATVTGLWITIMLVVISLNLVTSRTPTPTDADIIEFNLGDNLHKSGKVPVYSKVQLKCPFDNPMWYKNGAKLSVEQRRLRTITFEKIKKADAGVYSCGPDESHGPTLILHVLPGGEVKSHFTGNMEVYSQLLERVDELQSHSEQDNYHERKLDDDADLDMEGNVPMDGTRLEGIVGSPPTWKDVGSLLNEIKKPFGSYVKIACLATGNPTPNITWSKNGEPIIRTMGEVVYRKQTIKFYDAIRPDSGLYKCTVCNVYGCIEHTTNLIIQDRSHKPIIVKVPENMTLTFGESGEFHCDFLSDIYQEVTWTFKRCNDGICTENENDSVIKSEVDPKLGRGVVLKLENVTNEDEGLYTCTALNAVGTSSARAYLRVLVKPNFAGNIEVHSEVSERADELHSHNESDYYNEKELDENVDLDNEENSENVPADGTQFEEDVGSPPMWKDGGSLLRTLAKPSGSYVRIPCLARGNPTPNITWTKDDKPILRTMGKVLYKKQAIRMDDAIPEDSGQYKCIICNQYGCIEHTTKLIIQDRVNHRPIVLEAPTNMTLTFGQSGEFHCSFLSDLTHEVAWTFKPCDDALCSENQNISVIKSDPERSDVLKLENVTHEDEGWYTCIAANSLGTSAASAYLRVVDELYSDVRQNSTPVKNHPFWIALVTVITGLLFLVICVFIMFFSRKLKHEKMMKHRMETVHQWTKRVIIYKPSADPGSPETMVMPIIKIEKQRTTLLQSSNTDPAPFNEYEFPLDANWEISRSQLTLGATLGEGAFGRVVMAEATGLGKNQGSCIVAVKMVKEGHTDADMASLVREMEVMKMIGKHINIINLLGCCSQDGPLYVIVEYAPHGNLKDFLKKHRPTSEFEVTNFEEKPKKSLTQKDLISFAFQVARGMQYLASRRCIHRDLAARNVLVSDDYVIKIADFGLARDIQDTDYYRKNTNGRLPIKWMAPESLQDKFYDTQSDVWSYGVLLWEIMTYGEQPYTSIMSAEELYNFLMSGQRMERPPRCSLNIYTLMRQCWNLNAHERPTFTDLVESLDKTLTSIANADEEYLDLDLGVQLHLQIDTPPSSDEETEMDADKYRYITKNTTTIPLLRNGK